MRTAPVYLRTFGITDKDNTQLLQLGNAEECAPPLSSVIAQGFISAWVNGSNEIPGPGGPNATSVRVVLQARSEYPGKPDMLAVNINPPLINQLGLNNLQIAYDLKVRATWGVGADKCIAVIDVLNGAQFSVVATELVIEALYTILDLQSGAGIPITVGANIGTHTRPGSAFGPSFTAHIFEYEDEEGTPIPAYIDVPAYAKAVTIYPALQNGGPVAVTMGFVQGTAASSFASVLQAANGCPCTYPIPNGTTRLKITPTLSTDKALIRFDLAL